MICSEPHLVRARYAPQEVLPWPQHLLQHSAGRCRWGTHDGQMRDTARSQQRGIRGEQGARTRRASSPRNRATVRMTNLMVADRVATNNPTQGVGIRAPATTGEIRWFPPPFIDNHRSFVDFESQWLEGQNRASRRPSAFVSVRRIRFSSQISGPEPLRGNF